MKRTAFIILVLVLWLATWKGPHPKAPAPQLASQPTIQFVIKLP
jgi:hypothetical protein